MSFPELFAIAVALAMDAFAVSVCAGCSLKRVTAVHFLRLSLTFGFFQFLMPVIGWALGLTVRGFIESWDHWIAFALLAWIGGNMIRGGGDDSTLIGVVCAVITALGLLAGKGLAHADIFGRRAELVGGCVLIGIGLKILYEHGVLS